MKQFVFLFLSLFAVGCVNQTKSYVIDGVPVTLEYGEGPERDHLALATGLFRQAAADQWPMDDELSVWRALRGIKYVTGPVENQAQYYLSESTVYSNWYSCVLDVPLFPALAAHYNVLLGSEETAEADLEWAKGLQDEHEPNLCSDTESGPMIVLPW